jgi:hypothetical protein
MPKRSAYAIISDHIATGDFGSDHRIKAHVDKPGGMEPQHVTSAVVYPSL